MWHQNLLTLPKSLSLITCSMSSVHPWTYGAGNADRYISTENAINYLSDQLTNASINNTEVVIIMIAATQSEQFLGALSSLNALFPLPTFKTVERLTKSALELERTKMQLPAQLSNAIQTCQISANRSALNAQSIMNSASAVAVDLESELKAFQEKSAADSAALAAELEELQKLQVPVFTFVASGDINQIAINMKTDIPEPTAIYTAAVMFIGDSLQPIRDMIL